MFTTTQVLAKSGVRYQKYASAKTGGVYLTAANQLVGTFGDLERYQHSDKSYFGWHKHHIVECDDLDRLGIAGLFPVRAQQTCVLLPERAHIGRISQLLRKENPTRDAATAGELMTAYGGAYELMGDYCGGGAANIRRELLAIVTAVFRLGGAM